MEETKKPAIGQAVTYVDEVRKEHAALITCVFSETCVNLVYVSGDEGRQDDYGRQIERETSCCHKSLNQFGRYWF